MKNIVWFDLETTGPVVTSIFFALTFIGIWALNYIDKMPENKLNSNLKKKIKGAFLVITFISFLCAFFTIVTIIP